MYVSARARLIIEQLLLSTQAVSIEDLERELDVSERTIRRDLKEIKQLLEKANLSLVKDKKTLFVDGFQADKQALKWKLLDLTYNEYSPEERQQFILKELLKATDVVKLISLANDLKVTVSTVSNDLNKLELNLPKSVKIEKRRGMGVQLITTEVEKRQLLSHLMKECYPESQLLQVFQNEKNVELTKQRLLHLMDQTLLLKVEQIVRKWKAFFPYEISDEAYVNFVVHMTISIERMYHSKFIRESANNVEIQKYPEYDLVKKMIAECFDMEEAIVPQGEIEYITINLRGAKAHNYAKAFSGNEQVQTAAFAKQIIKAVEQKLQISLSSPSLLKGLVAHLQPTLRRLNEGMRINNPLIDSIKKDYKELFAIVREAFDETCQGVYAPDEEIGYLVLHFGASLNQMEEEIPLSAIIVCASGIGTSKMLTTRLRQALPRVKKITTVSLFELTRKMAENNYDLIISTIDLGDRDFPYFHVSPILTEKEISAIEISLQQKHSVYHKKISNEETDQQLTRLEAIHLLENRQHYLATVLEILKMFQISFIQNGDGEMEDVLRAICMGLLENDTEIEVESLVKALLVHEKWSGFGILNTKMALFHARSEAVKQPIFRLCLLENSMKIPAMGGGIIDVSTVALLLAPEKFSQQGLEIMSAISAMLIESDEVIEILQSGNKQEMMKLVVGKLISFSEQGE